MSVHIQELEAACPGFAWTNNLVRQNLWAFQSTVGVNDSSINSNIAALTLSGYKFALNQKLLNRLAFVRIIRLRILRFVGSIQSDLFKSFKRVRSMYFEMDSLRNFFPKIGIGWSLSLANNTVVTFSNYDKGYANWENGERFTYPSRDFCLFAEFPHKNGILPILDSANITECTSTIAWLTLHYNQYDMVQNSSVFTANSLHIHSICAKSNFSNIYETFFKSQAKKCKFNNPDREYEAYPEYYKLAEITMLAQDLIGFFLITSSCLLGLI